MGAAHAPAKHNAPKHAGAKPPAPNLDFIERFETLDEEGRWYISDGWSNADYMASTWRRSQIALTPDGLTLKLSQSGKTDKPYDGAEIRTRQELPYGYFETRMQAPRGWGLIAGLFTYIGPKDALTNQEIDIEILGRDTRAVELTIHTGKLTETKKLTLPFDAADGFHTYAFDWRPKYVRWYVDGKRVLTMRGKAAPIPTRPQNYMLDLWNSERLLKWSGGIKPGETGPWTLTASCMAYAAKYPGKPLCTP